MNNGIKVLLGVLGGVLLLLVGVAVLSGPFGSGSMMGPGGMMGGGFQGTWWGVLWMLVPLLFWVGLLAVIVWAVLRISSGWHAQGTGASPAYEMLRQRFARGEIDAEEYEERLRVLGGSSRRKVSG